MKRLRQEQTDVDEARRTAKSGLPEQAAVNCLGSGSAIVG